MDGRNANKVCQDPECRYGDRQHFHILTNSGSYVRFVVEKPKQKNYD
jgi:hypothetical protein